MKIFLRLPTAAAEAAPPVDPRLPPRLWLASRCRLFFMFLTGDGGTVVAQREGVSTGSGVGAAGHLVAQSTSMPPSLRAATPLELSANPARAD